MCVCVCIDMPSLIVITYMIIVSSTLLFVYLFTSIFFIHVFFSISVHADSCPLSNNPTPDSRFGDTKVSSPEANDDEHVEFRRRLELMGGCE